MLTISKSIPIFFVLDGSGVASGSLPPPFLPLTEYPVYASVDLKIGTLRTEWS